MAREDTGGFPIPLRTTSTLALGAALATPAFAQQAGGRQQEMSQEARACVGPPERIDQLVSGIQRQVETLGESEVPSMAIGEMVMDGLRQIDSVVDAFRITPGDRT